MRVRLSSALLAASLSVSLTGCGVFGGDDEDSSSSGSSAEPVAELKKLTGKTTQVKVAPSFLKGLSSLGLTPGVVGKATLKKGVLTFPITGGNATYYKPGSRKPYVESSIVHRGSGLSLTDGKTKVELTNFTVDAGKSLLYGDVAANGKGVAKQAELMFLDGRTLKPLDVSKDKKTGVLEGTTVSLTKDATALLNKTYRTKALKPFFEVGTATITLALS